MPLLWRYLLKSYFKVFSLCVLGFISVLLVMRFTEIAQFASTGAPLIKVGVFIFLLIPYILPTAIPISCLITSILLFQRLSHTQELTALRASGLNLRFITYPLFFTAALLSLLNFTFASEIGPKCRGLTKQLIYEITAQNPLFILQKDPMVKVKNVFFDIGKLDKARNASDVIVVKNNKNNGRLSLMTAKELSLKGEHLTGKHVCIITSVDGKEENAFDHLVLENQEMMSTQASNLSQGMQKVDWSTNFDYMPLKMLLAKKHLHKAHSPFFIDSIGLEIAKRLSTGLAAFSFTLIGIAFGMDLGRTRSKKGSLAAIGLALFYLLCFVGAKSMRHSTLLPFFLYLVPHPIILLFSLRALKRVNEGVE